ncbi:MAG: hypothetical protein ABI446_03235 [Gemmatimonadaceae bacterium]
MRLSTLLALSLAASAWACPEIVALPSGGKSFDPPAEYQLWWQLVESCSGLHQSLSSIEWYVVPGDAGFPVSGGDYDGYWFEQGNHIVLTAATRTNGAMVRHEMLHALSRAGHTRYEFLERCAGVVECDKVCISDAGSPFRIFTGTPLVSATDLEVKEEIEPASASASTCGGYFALVDTAHNPATHNVVIHLEPYGDGNLGVSFKYLIGTETTVQVGSFDVAHDAEETFFRAG